MVRVPITMSVHVQQGKATGYYLIAKSLFRQKVVLGRRQFAGYSDSLILTVGGIEHFEWDSVLKMAVNLPVLGDRPVNWLMPISQYASPGGFRMYLPGKLLMPTSAEETMTNLYGEWEKVTVADTTLYYLRVPLIGGDVLLGRRKLKDANK